MIEIAKKIIIAYLTSSQSIEGVAESLMLNENKKLLKELIMTVKEIFEIALEELEKESD